MLVFGGAFDFVVDREGLEEIASWFVLCVEFVVEFLFVYDVMLDVDWEIVVVCIECWFVDNGL